MKPSVMLSKYIEAFNQQHTLSEVPELVSFALIIDTAVQSVCDVVGGGVVNVEAVSNSDGFTANVVSTHLTGDYTVVDGCETAHAFSSKDYAKVVSKVAVEDGAPFIISQRILELKTDGVSKVYDLIEIPLSAFKSLK